MSLKGTYVNENQDETLVISEANDSDGSLSGTLSTDGKSFNITGHYHYKNNTGNATIIRFMGGASTLYESWSGTADRGDDFASLNVMGSRAIVSDDESVFGLGGPFVKQ